MTVIEIVIPNRTLVCNNFPQSWEDLTSDQIIHILTILYAPFPLQVPKSEIYAWQNFQIFKAITGFTDDDINDWMQAQIFEDPENGKDYWLADFKSVIDELTSFMLIEDKKQGTRELKNTIYKNPLPKIKLKNAKGMVQWYHAAYCDAENPFRDCTLNELSQIFTQYQDFNESNDELHLNRLLAIIYRVGKSRHDRQNDDVDDPRMPLENAEKHVLLRSLVIGIQIPIAVKRMMFVHITSALDALAHLYPDIFNGESKSNEQSDWIDFVLELTDYDISKKEFALKQNAHDALTIAQKTIVRNEKRLREAQS